MWCACDFRFAAEADSLFIAFVHIPNLTLQPRAYYVRVCLAIGHIWPDRWRNPVMEMTSSPSIIYLTPKFDDFLFARINDDSEATPLSVLSVLARLGVDPWEEAAKLAQLPRVSAAKKLVEFIAATPGAPSAYLSAKTVSDKLIDLLPSSAGAAIQPSQERGVRALTKSRLLLSWPVVIAVFLAILLIVISVRSAVQVNEPQATSSSTVLH